MTGPMNPYDAPVPERRGMSGTTKVLLGFGIGCGALALLCCGVLGVGGFAAYRFAQNSISDDPAKIREVADEIVTIQIPDTLAPKMAVDARMPFTGVPIMKGVAYMDADEKSFVLLGEANPEFESQTGDIELHFKKAMKQQGRRERDEPEVIETEPVETTIHDEPAQFKLSRVIDRKSEVEFFQAEGSFRGNGGPAKLIVEVKSPDFTKEQVLEIIKSMK